MLNVCIFYGASLFHARYRHTVRVSGAFSLTLLPVSVRAGRLSYYFALIVFIFVLLTPVLLFISRISLLTSVFVNSITANDVSDGRRVRDLVF